MVKSKEDVRSPRRNRSLINGKPSSRCEIKPDACKGNIRVIIRVRPPNDRELGDNSRFVVKVTDNQTIVFDPKEDADLFFFRGVQQRNRDITKKANKNLHFTFDRVFAQNANNNDVFQDSTKSLIQSFMNGFNCSVFVYGATGAGKTHTMLGHERDAGITVLTINELFKQKSELLGERDFELGISYLEVYNENIQDLLNPGPILHLREDPKFGVTVSGIQVYTIEEVEDLFKLLKQGSRNRTQHPTDANAESSRSHAIFQVYLRMKFKLTKEVRVAKLSMIDLAGSERGSATGYGGARFTEGANINKSLLALGNCINGLASGQRHIPYRDSKLTRLLKDSLGGNCQTVMVANISPSSLSYEDTYNTLKYATRAKKIRLLIKKNVVNSDGNLSHYKNLVEKLTKENEELKLQLSLQQKPLDCEEVVLNDQSEVKNKLQVMYTEKHTLEEQIQQLESAEQVLIIRKQLKKDSDARLSGICITSAEKKRGHQRLENTIECLGRQAANLQNDIIHLNESNAHLETQIEEFLVKVPHLKSVAEMENSKLACFRANSKVKHLQKVCDIHTRELKMHDNLIRRFSKLLQTCFLQLRGHGYVTEDLTTKYNSLVRHLQGLRSVTWNAETPTHDSSITHLMQNEEIKDIKQNTFSTDPLLNCTFVVSQTDAELKAEANNGSETMHANNTFLVESQKKPIKSFGIATNDNQNRNKAQTAGSKNIMSKVSKPFSNEKLLKMKNISPRMLKENVVPMRYRLKLNPKS